MAHPEPHNESTRKCVVDRSGSGVCGHGIPCVDVGDSGLPNYRNSWKRQGYSDEDFVRGGSERLKDALVTFGDEEAAGRMIQAHFDAGADQVLLQLLGEDITKPPAEDWKRMSDYLQLTRH